MIYLAALLGFLSFLGIAGYEGYTHGESHIQAQWDADKVAQAKVLTDAQTKLIEAQNARDTLQTVVERDHETLDAQNTQLIASDAQRVHDIAAALRRSALSGPVGHPAGSVSASTVPASDGQAAGGLEQISADISAVEQAGYADSAELTGILALAPPKE